MLKTYTVSPRSESTFVPFQVEAESYNEAAHKAAAKLHARSHARRVTGTPDRSGVFQAYRYVPGGTETSVGGNFHLVEE